MSWIAEYDTQGREFPTCVHVTKTTGTMTHGVTYVPIEDGKAVRAENDRLRELVAQRTAKRVVVSNAGTDYATGHCACGACGGAIDPWDAYCRHCGAKLEEDA